MPEEEDILIGKAQAGDCDALNELVSTYWYQVYRFISCKTSSPEDAQELTQETFFRAFRSLPNYQKTKATFKTYLGRIALNLVIDFWRRNRHNFSLSNLSGHQELVTEDDQPDVQAINQERRQAIAGILKELPHDQRQAVELRILAGLPVRETAVVMGKSEAAVKMLQQRALKNLRTLLLDRRIIENGNDRR